MTFPLFPFPFSFKIVKYYERAIFFKSCSKLMVSLKFAVESVLSLFKFKF